MEYQKIVTQYEHWLTHREYSPATIQKYTRALTRFFADTGAGKKPTRETVAAWRDSLTAKGYTPSTVNALLAAVNDYQESIDNPAGKAKPLKRQRRIFADPGRELTRAEYFRLPAARATSAASCCWRPSAPPASVSRSCSSSRRRPSVGIKPASAVRASAARFYCPLSSATG